MQLSAGVQEMVLTVRLPHLDLPGYHLSPLVCAVVVAAQGLADTFLLLGMPFDSSEAAQLNKEIFATIYFAGQACSTSAHDLTTQAVCCRLACTSLPVLGLLPGLYVIVVLCALINQGRCVCCLHTSVVLLTDLSVVVEADMCWVVTSSWHQPISAGTQSS